ncbi:MAG: aminoacyl-histidine dipeptidase [Clostridiales bacterium 38-18]|nr:MAG: aminoacyl-histidine dipeptidase [Clostridiales bacterium 38-18]
MDYILTGLQPESVFKNFEELTRIPRESGNEAGVADYLVAFANRLGLEVIKEPSNNIIIKKQATKGYENGPTVILQGHTDMVCVKLDDLNFDFLKEPIPLVVEDDFVKTKGTTLGADNGIAVAMAMSILESSTIEHPNLIALFTVAEETGMDGVVSLVPEHVKGDILINMDSEEEGTLLASCAGGVNNIVEYPIVVKEAVYSKAFKIVIQGLNGGHSGIEINKNRANAIKLLGRLMANLEAEIPFEVVTLSGGEKMNAIAKRAEVTIQVDSTNATKLNEVVKATEKLFINEFMATDGGIQIVLSEAQVSAKVLTDQAKKDIIHIIRLTPFGVQTMSGGIEGLVESSSNLGVLTHEADCIRFTNAVRSSVKSLKKEINERFAIISEMTGSKNYLVSDYPEWQYKLESPIRELMKTVYGDLYGKELKVDAIHAGLECGFLKEKVGDIDMISLGPNLFDVHTPYEKLSISSTERTFNFVCEVLKRLK